MQPAADGGRQPVEPHPCAVRRDGGRPVGADRRAASRERFSTTAISRPCWSASTTFSPQYAQYPAVGEPTLTANVQAAGAELGNQVNRLANAGAKVIVDDDPRRRLLTPFALAEKAAHIDTDRAALITRLVAAFNARCARRSSTTATASAWCRSTSWSNRSSSFPGLDGISNTTDAACDLNQSQLTPQSILDCTDLTLVPNATADVLPVGRRSTPVVRRTVDPRQFGAAARDRRIRSESVRARRAGAPPSSALGAASQPSRLQARRSASPDAPRRRRHVVGRDPVHQRIERRARGIRIRSR